MRTKASDAMTTRKRQGKTCTCPIPLRKIYRARWQVLGQEPVEVGKKPVEIELVALRNLGQCLLRRRRTTVAPSDLVGSEYPSRGRVEGQRGVDGHHGCELFLHDRAILRS